MRAADILTPLFLALLVAPAALRIDPDFSTQPREVFMRALKLDEVKAGDVVVLDGGFSCRAAGPARVFTTADGRPFVACRHGRHLLDGQQEEDGMLVGVYAPPPDFDPMSFDRADFDGRDLEGHDLAGADFDEAEFDGAAGVAR